MKPPVNILLVDDDTRNLDVLESVLESPDYGVVRAHSGEEALRYLLNDDFAAIVLDIHMPEITGIELANLIKQRKRTQYIPIIFLTAYYQADKDVLEGYSIGAVDYLTKPLNPKILKSKINVFVELFRATHALAVANSALQEEVAQRVKAETALRQVNNELEVRVKERTADLSRANEELRQRGVALQERELQAQVASRAKDDFLAALSHELRTPLNPVLLISTEAAGNPTLPASVRADFETIAKNVALEARLIDDLLDLTRITHGKLKLDMKPCDIHASLRDALEMTHDDITHKRIRLQLRLSAPNYLVQGDDVRLKQIFWNVIKNAVKFTPEQGEITVETKVTGDGALLIAVTDTGIGMSAAEIEHVFQAFFQGNHVIQNNGHRFGGLGLGLAISKMMVKLHAGSISVTSAGRNQGTTVSVQIPLLQQGAAPKSAAPAVASLPPAVAAPNGSHSRVLLVEDHPSTAQALAQLLTRRKYNVQVANCLAEARLLSSRESFDLLISDIGLPDGTGYELMTELRNHPGVVGIALTGYGSEEDVQRSLAAGFLTQLTKPVSVQELDKVLSLAMQQLTPARETNTAQAVTGSANGKVK